jgi:DGQHR domain-containing protein
LTLDAGPYHARPLAAVRWIGCGMEAATASTGTTFRAIACCHQVRQKDSVYYFVAYPAEDLLEKVRFISRYYGDGEQIAPDTKATEHDEIASFISKVERSDSAFQRQLSGQGTLDPELLRDRESQRRSPAVLLFTHERLQFDRLGQYENVGNLEEPKGKFLVIDGQHRLAALQFYLNSHPKEAASIHVPCVIFDGKQENFAAEMFVIINSTPTRINKSHLVDLYERVSYVSPDKKFAARVVDMLYSSDDSPCSIGSTASADAASSRSGSCKPSCSTRSTAGYCRCGSASSGPAPTSATSRSSMAWCGTSSRPPRRCGATRGETRITS